MLETSRNKAGQICNEKATMSYFLLCVCVHVRVHVWDTEVEPRASHFYHLSYTTNLRFSEELHQNSKIFKKTDIVNRLIKAQVLTPKSYFLTQLDLG
jgi:hypothetical protein